MIMESVMDFSAGNSERGSSASSPHGESRLASPSGKATAAPGPAASPPLTPPRDATPNNNNNNNNSSKDMEGPIALLQAGQHLPHGPHGPLGPHGPPHPMAPPHPMSPMRHLGPPGLGLFNSLMGSPLEFMAAAQAQAQAQAQGHHGHPAGHQSHQGHQGHPGGHPPRSYNSPPPISSSDPTANECKLVTYRGQKVAAFMISGETMMCLPQAFELFLKHLVGGLHTVYTKLKRLDIVPLVCNVEQVRILRGLGAIQPGVNRCKLLSCKDFDTLYRDCTTARCLMSQRAPADSRPGRPAAKRVPMGLGLPAGLQGSLQGHPQLKKHRLENGDFAPFENGHLGGADKSPLLANGYNAPPSHLQAMQQLYQHPLLSPGLPHPALPAGGGPGAGAAVPGHPHAPHPALHPALPPGAVKPPGGLPGMDAIANWENCRAAYEDIVKQLERIQQERGEAEAPDGRARDLSSHNGSPNGHSPVLNLSKGGGGSRSGAASPADNSDSDPGASDKDDDEDDNISNPEDDDDPRPTDLTDGHPGRSGGSPLAGSPPPYGPAAAMGAAAVGSAAVDLASGPGGRGDSDEEGGSSAASAASAAAQAMGAMGAMGTMGTMGTTALLRNIQRLLKVAAETARAQEHQVDMDRAELKMDVMRERELKESLERRLVDESRTRMLWQKRLQKERKARRRLQEQLELEMKRRAQLEEALRSTVGADVLARELDSERKPKQEPKQDAASPSQDPPHHHLQPKQGPSTPPHHQAHGPPLGPQHAQIAKHQQTSPLPERLSPAMLDSRPSYFKSSVLFGGAS